MSFKRMSNMIDLNSNNKNTKNKCIKMTNCINTVDHEKKKSVGELVVASILENLGIRYFYDAPCNKLRGVKNGMLRFDFCIPLDQTAQDFDDLMNGGCDYLVLEYNGIFHYHIIQGKTTTYTLTKQQMNDFIKDDYCQLNNIPILWIPYWHHVKHVKQLVHNFIRENFPNHQL